MVRSDRNQRVVIFDGAGASKAVNAKQFPATKEFFERLPDEVTGDQYFQFVLRHLSHTYEQGSIDVEMVLWELQSLFNFFKLIADSRNVVGRAVNENILRKIHQSYNFGNLQSASNAMLGALGTTIGKINEQVYDLYSYEPSNKELSDKWTLLLSKLLNDGHIVDIFTTNYDLVIESALNHIGAAKLLNDYLGASGGLQKSIDLSNWQEDSKRSLGLLTKLHGSLNWKRKAGSIYIGDSIFTGSHEKQAIIYPGFKGVQTSRFSGRSTTTSRGRWPTPITYL
jgi:hypothetical protein